MILGNVACRKDGGALKSNLNRVFIHDNPVSGNHKALSH